MKEYDEDEAVRLMSGAIAPNTVSEDDIYQILDLIFDYYDENGELDIDADSDEDTDVDAMTDFIAKYLKGKSETEISKEQIKLLVQAEIAYEDSLL